MPVDIERARKDKAYRQSLTPEERKLVDQADELGEDALAQVSGGTGGTLGSPDVVPLNKVPPLAGRDLGVSTTNPVSTTKTATDSWDGK